MKAQHLIISALGLCGPLFCLASCGTSSEPSLSSVSISSDPVIDDPDAEEAKFEDFSLFYVPERGGYLVGDYKGSLTSIVVPTQATGKDGITAPVVGLADYAFNQRKAITTVLLGESITYIGNYVFMDTNITDLRIAGGLTYLGDHAFDGSKVTFYEKEGIEYLPTWDKPYGTAFCGALDARDKLDPSCTHLVIKPGAESVDDYAFKGFDSLESVCLPASLRIIGYSAFERCTSLKFIAIPASTFMICRSAFSGCESLTDFYISVSSLSDYFSTHYGREYLGKPVHLMDANWREITSIEIPSSVTSLGEYAFYNCSSLASVTIPSSVTEINYGAFINCSAMEKIVIPASVAKMGERVFLSCSSLTIYCERESQPSNWPSEVSNSWTGGRPVVWGYKG